MASDQDDIEKKVKANILARRGMFKDQRIPFKRIGKNAAKRYLTKLIKLTVNLRDHLHQMPLEARETGVTFPGDLVGFGFELDEEQFLLEVLFPELGIDASSEHRAKVRRGAVKKEKMQIK
jgi:hypothetical protein